MLLPFSLVLLLSTAWVVQDCENMTIFGSIFSESCNKLIINPYLGFNIFGCFIGFERHRLAITDHNGGAAALSTALTTAAAATRLLVLLQELRTCRDGVLDY